MLGMRGETLHPPSTTMSRSSGMRAGRPYIILAISSEPHFGQRTGSGLNLLAHSAHAAVGRLTMPLCGSDTNPSLACRALQTAAIFCPLPSRRRISAATSSSPSPHSRCRSPLARAAASLAASSSPSSSAPHPPLLYTTATSREDPHPGQLAGLWLKLAPHEPHLRSGAPGAAARHISASSVALSTSIARNAGYLMRPAAIPARLALLIEPEPHSGHIELKGGRTKLAAF